MDDKTAVKWLKEIERKYIHGGDDTFDYLRKEAINLATDKLSAQPERTEYIPETKAIPSERENALICLRK